MIKRVEEREKARQMRLDGKSYGEIATALKVARSSVSNWVRDIRLSDEQIENILKKWKDGSSRSILIASRKRSDLRQKIREGYRQEGKELAEKRDADFWAGCMLYWAEGTKTPDTCIFTNSDPRMLKYFVSFLKKYFSVNDVDIKVKCHYYGSQNELTNHDVEGYWQEKIGLPSTCFKKTTFTLIERKSDTKRQERTKYGVARIVVHDVKIVQTIYGAIDSLGEP